MSEVSEAEQWKLEGDCSKCERRESCQRKCTAAKRAQHRADEEAFEQAADEFLHYISGYKSY